jgi:yersiniabactin synthetase, thioesterase component
VYPGRDHRINEAVISDIGRLAATLATEITRGVREHRHWILGGHSMGAQVAFEICLLTERWGIPPVLVVLSGCQAPHLMPRRRLSHLDDAAFIEQLMEIGGSPPEMRSDSVFRQIFLPVLRADFRTTENYRRELKEDRVRLKTPTLLVYGTEDSEASREEVDAWRLWLSGPTELRGLEGGHFHLIERPRAFLDLVAASTNRPGSILHPVREH